MSKYEYLKKYRNPKDTKAGENSFYSVSAEKILTAEKALQKEFPKSLKVFWKDIGYGFFGASCKELGITQIDYSNRLLTPGNIVSILQEGEDSGLITEQGLEFLKGGDIPIFEVEGFTSYLVMKPNSDKPNAVYDIDGSIIEDSLETFIWKLYHVSPTYYLAKL